MITNIVDIPIENNGMGNFTALGEETLNFISIPPMSKVTIYNNTLFPVQSWDNTTQIPMYISSKDNDIISTINKYYTFTLINLST